MFVKFILPLAFAYIAWRLYRGFGRHQRRMPEPSRLRTAEDDACDVLGVARDADAETIRAAHRRLIRTAHPDAGGSAELTRRINAARDLLLRSDGH
jgi:DnaJ-domain-containing protein 1